MSNEYQRLGSDYDFSNERFQPVFDVVVGKRGNSISPSHAVIDNKTGQIYYFNTKEKARDKARAWNYEWDELSLNQFREGC